MTELSDSFVTSFLAMTGEGRHHDPEHSGEVIPCGFASLLRMQDLHDSAS